MSPWNEYHKVEATIVSGGGLCQLKGIPQDSAPRRMSVWLYEERSSVLPYGAPDQRTMFTPDRLTIKARRHSDRPTLCPEAFCSIKTKRFYRSSIVKADKRF